MRKETSAAGETRVRQSDDETENTACLEREHRRERSRKQKSHETQRREEANSIIIQHFWEKRKKPRAWRQSGEWGSSRLGEGWDFLVLEGEVDACRYCTLGVHHPARWMSCFTTAKTMPPIRVAYERSSNLIYSPRLCRAFVVDDFYSIALGQSLTIGGTCARGDEP